MMIALQTLLRPWKLVFVLTGLICILIAEDASACDFNPTAVMNHETGAVFIDDDTVLLSGSQSTANNCSGYIDQYRWQVRPVGGSWTTLYTGTSSTYSYSFPTLSAGENQKDYQVRLRVRNNIGLYNTKTITVTVARSHKSYYYLTDHLGSVRVTVNDAGDPVGWDDYYPFGLQMPGRTQNASNPNDDAKFTGYILEQDGDLGLYHAEARTYDPVIGRFMQIDPLLKQFPEWTPYHYTHNNPLNMIDPTGMFSTLVEKNKDGTYSVIGGDPNDGDTGIYVGSTDGERIGESLTTHSFFDENDNAVVGAQIDLNDTEGDDFIMNEIIEEDPGLITALGFQNEGSLDFKDRGKTKDMTGEQIKKNRYRGSKILNGKIASARDVGNLAAGIVAGRVGLTLRQTQQVFDIYQGGTEPTVSAKAQDKGWYIGVFLRITRD